MLMRGEVRKAKGIDGSPGGDCFHHFCCPLCSLCQEARETGALGSTDMAAGGGVIDEMIERA